MPTATTAELVSINPATGEAIGAVPVTSVDEIDGVVARSHAAQVGWGATSLEDRIACLRGAVPLIEARTDELGDLMTAEQGKPIAEARGEVGYSATSLGSRLDSLALSLAPEILEDGRTRSTVYRDPFGVCGAITPWNFPFLMPLQIVISALAAGNTVVLKPSEQTPLIGQAFADLLSEVLPPDVMICIQGGDDQGKALVLSDVNLIGFVGSRDAGAHILTACAKDLKRVVLELGGKDPMIVLDGADIEKAADFAVHNSFRNCGQVCVSTERIYVQESIADIFEQAVIDRVSKMHVGDGADTTTTIGPMVSEEQKTHVIGQLKTARDQGATFAIGGETMDGNYVDPTVLTGLDHTMDIMRDETFGPVACIMRVADGDAAVEMANDTPYGLGAAVFGPESPATAEVARQLTAGMVGVNQGCGGAAGTPWVGARQSGYGYHSGPEGDRQFAQVRVVSTPAT